MHATLRRYEGVDQSRTDELKRKVTETLVPRLIELPQERPDGDRARRRL